MTSPMTPSSSLHTPDLCFSTPSKFDLRALTIMGINSKPNSTSPIGFFGTGLKYAIAVFAREHCSITLQDPREDTLLQVLSFETSFRGKTFQGLRLAGTLRGEPYSQDLPFTTELGKTWTPLMAYRELVTNTLDEGGTRGPSALPESFTIALRGEAIRQAASQHHIMFLPAGKPLWSCPAFEVYPSTGRAGVFYRGVKVFDSRPSAYTYNLLIPIRLTEDRTASLFDITFALSSEGLWSCPLEGVFKAIAEGRQGPTPLLETDLYSSHMPKDFATKLISRFESNAPCDMALVRHAYTLTDRKPQRKTRELTEELQEDLSEALAILEHNGVTITAPVEIIDSDPGLLGQVDGLTPTIYLTSQAFESGMITLVGTLYEEHIHLTRQLEDHSREFQNHLVDTVARLMTRIYRKSRAQREDQ